jgi:predicted phage baseplate assembly protein
VTLHAPNLDDRRFQDLVDDAKRYVQRRCPQWSDHNVSDPGVTRIETFAMVADQLMYRLNRVPDRLYLKFLELLGIDIVPPVPARADVTFWLTAPREDTVTVRAGTEVATDRVETVAEGAEAAVAFETVEDLAVLPCSLAAVATAAAGERPVDRTDQLADQRTVACFGDDTAQPQVGDAVLFGLSTAVPRCAVAIRVDCRAEGAGVDPRYPPWQWEAWTGRGWTECELEPGRDGTGGFNRPGDVVMHVPATHVASVEAGRRAGWLRCSLVDRRPFYQRSPYLVTASAFTVGGTIPAVHAETVRDEIVGLSEGVPGQRFRLGRGPVLGGVDEPLVVEVAGGSGQDGWEAWERVEHFDASRETDRHFRLEVATGEIVFGPGVRQLDGTLRQFGAVPDTAAPIRASVYRVGGGSRGNVAAAAITTLRTSVPFVASRLGNRRPATGGVDGEDIEAVKRRAPAFLRTRQRAVTTSDYEYLATAADPRAARTRCLAGDGAEQAVIRLAVVPVVSGDPGRPADLSTFLPDPQLLARISADLDARRVLGTRLIVEAPFYQRITAEARCTAAPRADVARVQDDALAALYRYLHPLAGGPEGTGWPFGRTVVAGELLALLARVPGVAQVEEVRLYRFDARTGARAEGWATRMELGAGALPFSVEHQVEVRPS